MKLARGRGSDGPPRPPDSTCSFDPATLTAPGCAPVFSDTGDRADVSADWGGIDCASASRHSLIGGGDPHVTAAGAAQPSDQAHQLTVLDGDDVWGERCELGENWRPTAPMPAYEEGQRRLTMLLVPPPGQLPAREQRLADGDADEAGAAGRQRRGRAGARAEGRRRELGASSRARRRARVNGAGSCGRRPRQSTRGPGSSSTSPTRATPAGGAITVYVDLNGDGDALDGGEQSSTFSTYTLKLETSGGAGDGLAVGDSVPSLLRAGIYHSPAIPCPPPAGCASQVDNVQIVG